LNGAGKIRLSAVILTAMAAAAVIWTMERRGENPMPPQSASAPLCRNTPFEGVSYIVCEVDPSARAIRLSRLQADGAPYRSLDWLALVRRAGGANLLMAMNAGMYHEDLSPVGLYVENGLEQAALQTGDGTGNFFMKPNGVFFIDKAGKAGVQTTQTYAAAGREAMYATQSGPMLVIDGALHPTFEQNGPSRNLRNGVGVRADGFAVFAISHQEVSFGSFARLFRDALQCPNALYFDGVVSAFSDGQSTKIGGGYPAGPIVSIEEKAAAPTQ
jgi:uncharacterized protein YigE (DUF2233 family)